MTIDVAWVPGAFEIPLVARRLARSGRFDGVICLGAVIRGETAHFDLVANEAARGIADAARDTGVPVIFEVLAVDNLSQAEDRAGGSAREQGLGGGGGGALDGVAPGGAPRGRDRLGERRRWEARRDRRQALGQGRHVRAEPALLGPHDHGGARAGDERPLPPDAGRDVGRARPRPHRRDREPRRGGAGGGGVHGGRRGDPSHPQHGRRRGAACSRSRTDTPPRTTPSGSRTRTGGRSRPTGDASSTPEASGTYTDWPAGQITW